MRQSHTLQSCAPAVSREKTGNYIFQTLLYFIRGTICMNLEAAQKGKLGAHLVTALHSVSLFSHVEFPHHHKPTNWKLQSPINKEPIPTLSSEVCCFEESFTFCLFYLLVMLGSGNRKERSDISATLPPPYIRHHCYFTLETQNKECVSHI